MAIEPKGDGHLLVAQPALDRLDVHAGGDEQLGVGVPKGVETHALHEIDREEFGLASIGQHDGVSRPQGSGREGGGVQG